MHVMCHEVQRESSGIKFYRAEVAVTLALFHWLKPLTDEEGGGGGGGGRVREEGGGWSGEMREGGGGGGGNEGGGADYPEKTPDD